MDISAISHTHRGKPSSPPPTYIQLPHLSPGVGCSREHGFPVTTNSLGLTLHRLCSVYVIISRELVNPSAALEEAKQWNAQRTAIFITEKSVISHLSLPRTLRILQQEVFSLAQLFPFSGFGWCCIFFLSSNRMASMVLLGKHREIPPLSRYSSW